MGEVIRNIGLLKLGGDSLSVELNEGFTEKQDEIIHLHFGNFRYAIHEKYFFKIATSIIRSYDELRFTKRQIPKPERRQVDFDLSIDTNKFPLIADLQKLGINYRIVETRGTVIMLLVKENAKDELVHIFKSGGAKKIIHPYSSHHGYKYVFRMPPFLMYEHNKRYYEIVLKLPIMAYEGKTWMPYPQNVQEAIWKDGIFKDNAIFIDKESAYIYRLGYCIFYSKLIAARDIQYLEDNCEALNNESFRDKLSGVYYEFTDILIDLLYKKDYNTIIKKYYQFDNY